MSPTPPPWRTVRYMGMDPTIPDLHRAGAYERGTLVAYYTGTTRDRAIAFAWARWSQPEPDYPCGLFKGPEDY